MFSRLLTGIQRFERTRKLTPERRDILYKWLHFGCIIIGPGGGGTAEKSEMDKDEAIAAASRVSIPDEIRRDLETVGSSSPKYAIDFLGCVRAFLSRPAAGLFGFETKERVKIITSTIERFMDYLMQHDVCPEYHTDILQTRNFCREATEQLWATAEAQRWLPGEFNIACSTLFDGNYAHDYDGETYWGEQRPGEAVFVGLTPEKATQIVGFGIVGTASNEVYRKYAQLTEEGGGEALEVIEVIQGQGFEIIKVDYPTAECKELYTSNSVEYRPLGKITAKSWQDPESPPEDLTADERKAAGSASSRTYVFFVEEIILQHLEVGQKIVATIRRLNCDIWFFDQFTRLYPSFELYILNELTDGYKKPRMLPGALAWEGMADGGDEHVGVSGSNSKSVEGDSGNRGHLEPSEVEALKIEDQSEPERESINDMGVEAEDDQEPY